MANSAEERAMDAALRAWFAHPGDTEPSLRAAIAAWLEAWVPSRDAVLATNLPLATDEVWAALQAAAKAEARRLRSPDGGERG